MQLKHAIQIKFYVILHREMITLSISVNIKDFSFSARTLYKIEMILSIEHTCITNCLNTELQYFVVAVFGELRASKVISINKELISNDIPTYVNWVKE